MDHPDNIILFDGVCNFCDQSVQWIIKRDAERKFNFASLQSDSGKQLLEKFNLADKNIDSVVFIHHGKAYIKSAAILQVFNTLGKGWTLFTIFKIIPTPIRDFFYDQFAKRRYSFFGKKTECMIPSPEQRKQFLP